jgi:hypothetical protein
MKQFFLLNNYNMKTKFKLLWAINAIVDKYDTAWTNASIPGAPETVNGFAMAADPVAVYAVSQNGVNLNEQLKAKKKRVQMHVVKSIKSNPKNSRQSIQALNLTAITRKGTSFVKAELMRVDELPENAKQAFTSAGITTYPSSQYVMGAQTSGYGDFGYERDKANIGVVKVAGTYSEEEPVGSHFVAWVE